MMFQITVSDHHDVKLSEIKIMMNAMKSASYRLYFSVPPDRFDDFKTPQKYVYSLDRVDEAVAKSIKMNVKQYALELPLESIPPIPAELSSPMLLDFDD
jgi:hypothetical protein